MSRTWVFIVFVVLSLVMFSTESTHGSSTTCVNDSCYTRASTSLLGVIGSALLALFVGNYPQQTGVTIEHEPVKLWERGLAFFIDFWVVLSVTTPVTVVPILLAEAETTGSFRWAFERDFSRPNDAALAIPGILAIFAVLFGYFYIHPKIGRATLGQYLMGFRVEGAPGADPPPNFALNVFLGWIGLCLWPISLIEAARREDKLFWWNLRARTRVVRYL